MRHTELRETMREAILDAAGRLLARYGYRKMTMEDLAREAGIGKGTIYLYLPGKEEVALSYMDRLSRGIQEQLQVVARSHGAPLERLREMLIQRVLLRFDAVQPFSQSLDAMLAALRPAFLARRERVLEAEAALFAGVLAEGQRDGAVAPGDPLQMAHTLLLATGGLMPFSLSPRELGARQDMEAKAARVAGTLLYGVARGDRSRAGAGAKRRNHAAERNGDSVTPAI